VETPVGHVVRLECVIERPHRTSRDAADLLPCGRIPGNPSDAFGDALGLPPIVRWSKDGVPLRPGGKHLFEYRRGVCRLIIPRGTRDDSGQYRCSVQFPDHCLSTTCSLNIGSPPPADHPPDSPPHDHTQRTSTHLMLAPNYPKCTEKSAPYYPQCTENSAPDYSCTKNSAPNYPECIEYSAPNYPECTENSAPKYPENPEYSAPIYPKRTEYSAPNYPESTEYSAPNYPESTEYTAPNYQKFTEYSALNYSESTEYSDNNCKDSTENSSPNHPKCTEYPAPNYPEYTGTSPLPSGLTPDFGRQASPVQLQKPSSSVEFRVVANGQSGEVASSS